MSDTSASRIHAARMDASLRAPLLQILMCSPDQLFAFEVNINLH